MLLTAPFWNLGYASCCSSLLLFALLCLRPPTAFLVHDGVTSSNSTTAATTTTTKSPWVSTSFAECHGILDAIRFTVFPADTSTDTFASAFIIIIILFVFFAVAVYLPVESALFSHLQSNVAVTVEVVQSDYSCNNNNDQNVDAGLRRIIAHVLC